VGFESGSALSRFHVEFRTSLSSIDTTTLFGVTVRFQVLVSGLPPPGDIIGFNVAIGNDENGILCLGRQDSPHTDSYARGAPAVSVGRSMPNEIGEIFISMLPG